VASGTSVWQIVASQDIMIFSVEIKTILGGNQTTQK